MGSSDEAIAALAMARSSTIPARAARELLKLTRTFQDALREGLGAHLLTAEYDEAISASKSEILELEALGITVYSSTDPEYPGKLRQLSAAPTIIFMQGNKAYADAITVSIIGTRKPTARGAELTAAVTDIFSRNQVTVATGLAEGIDTVACTASLRSHNKTIGVIGTGIDVHFPTSNRTLQESVARNGLLLSQFLPGSAPTKQSFPIRNATMTALSDCNIVIEASEFSGTRSQVNAGFKIGKPSIISRQVATRTNWGQELASTQNDIFVFDAPEEAWDIFQNLRKKA